MAGYVYSEEDDLYPVYCAGCGIHLPRMVSEQNDGKCFSCHPIHPAVPALSMKAAQMHTPIQTPMVPPRPSITKQQGWAIGCGAVLFFVVIGSLFQPTDKSSVFDPSVASFGEPGVSPPVVPAKIQKPLSAAQKLKKAKAIYATWSGDIAQYEKGIELLKGIARKDRERSAAQQLLRTWERREQQRAERAVANEVMQERKDARYYSGPGDVEVAIGSVVLRRSVGNYVANRDSTYVLVLISCRNVGDSQEHVNPNDFTLSDSNGNTASHETETYALSNYFDAVNLQPGQQTSGWLAFLMRKDKRYKLTRTGMLDDPVTKPVIP